MKNILVVVLSIFLNCCCNQDRPYAIASIDIHFEGIDDSELIHAWVIEISGNNPSIMLDSIHFGLINGVKNHSVQLLLKKFRDNGDYYIYADSVEQVNKISNVEVIIDTDRCGNETVTFSYDYNGLFKTHKDGPIIISR